MTALYITHYYVRGTDPWQNIMLLPEKEAFRVAADLAAAYPGRTSFGRFADFEHYYPLRKAADELVREGFIRLGGKPRLAHPYSFVLGESDYLKGWFDGGESLRIPLEEIPEDRISFTLGDSCAKYTRQEPLEVFTKRMICEKIRASGGSLEELVRSIAPYGYVEAQLWTGEDRQ